MDRSVELNEFGRCLKIVRNFVGSPEDAITIGDAIGLIHPDGAESKIDASKFALVSFKTDMCNIAPPFENACASTGFLSEYFDTISAISRILSSIPVLLCGKNVSSIDIIAKAASI